MGRKEECGGTTHKRRKLLRVDGTAGLAVYFKRRSRLLAAPHMRRHRELSGPTIVPRSSTHDVSGEHATVRIEISGLPEAMTCLPKIRCAKNESPSLGIPPRRQTRAHAEQLEWDLVSASPDQFSEVSRFAAIEGKTWNHPVLVGDVLLVRNGEEMAAFRLAVLGR